MVDRPIVAWCRLNLVAAAILVVTTAAALVPASTLADITCYDFDSQAEAQAVYDALPSDPYEIDSGWPLPGIGGGGDQEAGNGGACDATNDIPEFQSPGNEEYAVGVDPAQNGLAELPDVELEKATIREVQYAGAVQTEENPDKLYDIMGIATPEFELYTNYEDREVPGQCGADATTTRLQELLVPGTTVWLEIDQAGFYTQNVLDRQLWIELDGRYRLVSEVLVSEGHAVVATERPGTGRGDATQNPPPGARYRDALREAQKRAIDKRVGLWGQCAIAQDPPGGSEGNTSDQPDAVGTSTQLSARCVDFDAWEWAQSVFESDPQANDALDPDNDGTACPELPHGGFAPAFWTDTIPIDVEEAKLVRTIDGDTFEVLIDGVSNRVRIYRADTPETQIQKQCGGKEATWFADYALSFNDTPGVVYLERDKTTRDRYGRELAYVWFTVAGDPYMLNHILINNGWAEDVDYGDHKYDQQLKDAAAFADRHDLGVWGLCGGFGIPLTVEPVTAPQPAEGPQQQAPEQPASQEPPPSLATEPPSDQETPSPAATELPLPPTEPPPPPTEPPPPPTEIPVDLPPEEPTAAPT